MSRSLSQSSIARGLKIRFSRISVPSCETRGNSSILIVIKRQKPRQQRHKICAHDAELRRLLPARRKSRGSIENLCVFAGARWVQPDRSRLGNSKKLAWILFNFFASLWCFFIYWSLLLFWTVDTFFCVFHSFLVDIERPIIRRIRSRFAFFRQTTWAVTTKIQTRKCEEIN